MGRRFGLIRSGALVRDESVDHRKQVDFLAGAFELARNQRSQQAAERPSDQAIRTVRLYLPDLLRIVGGHRGER